ncbi:terpene synthase family protein [Streptomyces apocyni]|uniref:terpene synthase family protein n=1 Tax=Streptomyces apocyni TaxID=2654677 RepID=UPI0012E9FB59|nr:lyase [Streptomyces apocyni]
MALLSSFAIPDFHLPFESTKHPQAEQANTEATSWALSQGLIKDAADDFSGIGCGHLAARVAHGATYRQLLLLSEWMAWSFVLDDQHDHVIRSGRVDTWRPVTDAINGHLSDGEDYLTPQRRHGNALVDGFTDLHAAILDGMPPGIRKRYRAHIPPMLRSLDQEAVNRGTVRRQPTVDDYVLMRRHSSQLLPMMDMVEASLGVEVPSEVYDSPTFQALLWSAVDIISWGNDIFSLRKEYACGDNNNLVLLLAWWEGYSLPHAVRAVKDRISARLVDFHSAARTLPRVLDVLAITDPATREGVARCVRSYEDWIIGADLWQRHECTRYSDERWVSGDEGAYTRPDLVAVA